MNTKQIMAKLSPCPRSGCGVHRWIFKIAVRLHKVVPDENEMVAIITAAVAGCGRDVPRREIEEAVRNSRTNPNGQKRRRKGPRWPSPNHELVLNITNRGPTLAELERLSPVKCTETQPDTEQIIDLLFPGNPLLCAGLKSSQALTRSREQWRGFLMNQQFIVPSPMSSVNGITTSGAQSMRSNANTGARRFLVVEFDRGTPDDQSALMLHLGEFAPLTLVVHSGNKSLHGWYFCESQKDEIVERFFKYAVSIGADPATWTRSQYVRNPGGCRRNGTDAGVRQRILYFNPKTLEAA